MESCAHGSGRAIIVSGHVVAGGVEMRSLFLCLRVAVPGYYEF